MREEIAWEDMPPTLPRLPRMAAPRPAPAHGNPLRRALASPWGQTALVMALALVVRSWFAVASHGMIDGDEALLGIVSEDILRGHLAVYIPGSLYGGVWDSYLLAPLLALFGPSAWAIRAVELVEFLALIPLMGALAARLFGERARLPALLLTALPPVYVGVTEFRMLSGYIETLLIGTALALLGLSASDHWRAGRPARWRWALAALLVGLGFWIDTLVLAYVIGVALWLAPLALARLRAAWRASRGGALRSVAVASAQALIAFLIGFAPALFSPITWSGGNPLLPSSQTGANAPAGASGHSTLQTLLALLHQNHARLHFLRYFFTEALPETLGVRMVYPPHAGDLLGVTLGVLVGLIILGGAITTVRALGWPRPLAALPADRARWNLALPIVLGVVILGGYLARKLLSPGVLFVDEARYLLPLTTPVTLALAYTYLAVSRRTRWSGRVQAITRRVWPRARTGTVVAAALLLLTVATFGAQWLASDPVRAFGSPFDPPAQLAGGAFPAEDTALLGYLESHDIHYVWANHWVGNPISYLTNERTVCSDWVDVNVYHQNDRFPAFTNAIERADRPSFIIAWAGPGPSPLATAFDALGVQYTSAQFGHFQIYTPITRTVQPQEVEKALVAAYW